MDAKPGTMSPAPGPVPLAERIFLLDVIRGVALLGILIMNMPFFGQSLWAGMDGSHPFPRWYDRTAETVRDVLFSGKFNSMFSMLFAVGFTIQLERLLARDPARARTVYLRRIGWLMVFGLLHACVLWTGDILHMYALFGLLLLALRRVPDRVLIGLVIACLLFPPVAGAIHAATMTPAHVQALVATCQARQATDNVALGSGGFLASVRQNVQDMIFFYGASAARFWVVGGYIQILTTMLLGLLLGRAHFFQRTGEHLPKIRRLQWWALGVGIATGVGFGTWAALVKNPLAPTPWAVLAGTAYVICRLAIMVFYVATLIRAVHNPRWQPRLQPIATVGRMALTNYLLQTLISISLFRSWGLGYWDRVGPLAALGLAVGIYALIQVPLSRWWLARFEMGPMERLWRVLTYGRPSVGRRAVVDEASEAVLSSEAA
jgi:uncharacterized protein